MYTMIIRNIKMQTHFDGCCNNLEYSNYINICFVNLLFGEYCSANHDSIYLNNFELNLFYSRVIHPLADILSSFLFKILILIFLYNVCNHTTHTQNRMIRYIHPLLGLEKAFQHNIWFK